EVHALTVEALLLQLADVTDPWLFLRRVRTEITAGEGGNVTDLYPERQRALDMFYALAARQSDSAIDALITEAHNVFHVSTPTARKEIARLREFETVTTKLALSVHGVADLPEDPESETSERLEWIAEAVRDPEDKAHPIKYVKWAWVLRPRDGCDGCAGTGDGRDRKSVV